MSDSEPASEAEPVSTAETGSEAVRPPDTRQREIGGPRGPEPTRFGDWEKSGRCIDF